MLEDLNNTVFSFFGPPGCGKGTLADKCKDALDFEVLSTGNLFRKHISEGTEIGKQVETLINAGHLISDDLTTKMVNGWLKNALSLKKPIILDGYPRTSGQAELFKAIVEMESFVYRFILFKMPSELIIRRLSNRRVCGSCQAVYSLIYKIPQKDGVCDICGSALIKRDDDKEEVIRERLRRFAKYKVDLLEFYRSVGQNVEILDVSDKSINEVFESFKKTL